MPFNTLKATAEKKDKIKQSVISYADFIAKQLPENKWVLDGLIPEGYTILSSAPGQYKTFILLALSRQIANGELGFNHFGNIKRNILFCNEEMSARAIQDRLKVLYGESPEGLYFTNLSGIKLEDMATIKDICKEKDITLVIFDSLTRIHSLSENDADGVKQIFEAMLVLLKEDISIIITHHHRKAPVIGHKNGSDEMRGSTDLLAQIDAHIAIDSVSGDKTYMVIKQLKLRQAENIPDFKVAIERDALSGKIDFVYKGEFNLEDARNIKIEDNKEIVISIIKENPGITKDGIFEKLNGKLGKMAIQDVLPKLEIDGMIFSQKKKPKTYYIQDQILPVFGESL